MYVFQCIVNLFLVKCHMSASNIHFVFLLQNSIVHSGDRGRLGRWAAWKRGPYSEGRKGP